MPDPVNETPIQIIERFNRGYIEAAINDRWGEHGKIGNAVRFTRGGIARMGQVVGFIYGLHLACCVMGSPAGCRGNGVADHIRKNVDAMANDLLRHFDFMANVGHKDEHKLVPNELAIVDSDKEFLSWRILWYKAVDISKMNTDQYEQTMAKAYKENDKPLILPYYLLQDTVPHAYRFDHNGGLVYMGPAEDNTLTINIHQGPVFWSIST